MAIVFKKVISPKSAAVWGAVFCLPFAFAITTAITNFEPFLKLISYHGRATPFGLFIFYIGMVGLPLAFIVNVLAMLSVNLKLHLWSIEGKISFHPKKWNMVIAVITLVLFSLFAGHMVIDALACLNGNIRACD